MVKIRKFCAYRRLERPYTRKSKYRKLSFVKTTPVCRIVRYDMGDLQKQFKHTIVLKSKADLNIRHNAIEAARQSSNRVLEKKVGKINYRMKIRIYPHHALRENPLASGAGADRMSTGMKKSFGKVIGLAARVRKDQILFQVDYDNKSHESLIRTALKRASSKFPCSCYMEIVA
jgi:large subunit ribosomal protein L10e